MNRNRSSADLLATAKSKKTKRSKPSLPLCQKVFYSAGSFLNDSVNAALCSYIIIFQTKVVGLSNSTAGLLLITCYAVDAVLSLFVGYFCDNVKFACVAKHYGQRKSFHLLGAAVVAGLFPLLMMPCFVCGQDASEWTMAVYYGAIMILYSVGWALSQVAHLALIPEIARRPSEMVELHAARSGVMFFSGIFMYVVIWIVLRTDGEQVIAFNQWKDFMEMALIVVGTGCIFAFIFHLGTKEPPALLKNDNGPSGSFIGRERQRSRSGTLPLPDKAIGVFCLFDERELSGRFANVELCRENVDTINEDETSTVVKNPTVSDGNEVLEGKTDIRKGCENNAFSFPNPAFLSEDKQSLDDESQAGGETSQSEGGSQTDTMEDRRSNRSDSSGSVADAGYSSVQETDSVSSIECSVDSQVADTQSDHDKPCALDISSDKSSPQSCSASRSRAGSLTEEPEKSYCGVSVIIEEVSELEVKNNKTRKTWIDWFKNPMFYKISFAFMCARLSQIVTDSYLPLYLIETLKFEKESIAYFPLVILISGVISSLGAKKFDKLLGAKWTYSLAASLVIGSAAWFYLQTESGKHVAYCAAIIRGCGSSVMYVTSLALAGELIGDNKESGAFVFASMTIFTKLGIGAAIALTQGFFPTDGSRSEYLRYVFSFVPGAGSLFGFLAVIAFLPATVRCKRVVHTVDSSVQTEDARTVSALHAYDNPMALDDCSEKSIGFDGDCKARVVA